MNMKITFTVLSLILLFDDCRPQNLRNAAMKGERRQLQADPVKVGANVMVTGPAPWSEAFARIKTFWQDEVDTAGGIKVGAVSHPLDLIVLDNENDIDKATANQALLIAQGVIATLGPYFSSRAIPAGAVSNEERTTMISATSTNPATTLNRPYVFRASFLDSFQGPMIARFVSTNYGFTKVAIVYECSDAYSQGLADYFKKAWDEKYGETVAYECIDVSANSTLTLEDQIPPVVNKVASTDADFMFLPTYDVVGFAVIKNAYENAAWNGTNSTAVEQARQMPAMGRLIVGAEAAIDNMPVLAECGAPCEGVVAVTMFDPMDPSEVTQKFVQDFGEAYNGTVPTSADALTYDAFKLIENAISNCGVITGDLQVDRDCVRDAMGNTTDFPGVAGSITFDANGDPSKCVNFVQVEGGKQVPLSQLCPETV